MTRPADRHLVLFDVDGTLLSAGGAFRTALAGALREVFGTEGPMDRFEFSGKTDPQIVRELMREAGVADAAIEHGRVRALSLYQARLVGLLRPEDVRAKPGAASLLARLAAAPELVTLGLLTGNLEACARAKLEPLDLNRYFSFGAYGSDAEDRRRLPELAVERALRATGVRFEGQRVVVVGDSVHDVRCGRHLGARAVAVATGKTPAAVLAAEQPSALLSDLTDTDLAFAALLGRSR